MRDYPGGRQAKITLWRYVLAAIAACLPAATTDVAGGEDELGQNLALCREAWRAHVEPPWHGTGMARYRASKDGKELYSMDLDIAVSGDKYRVDMRPLKNMADNTADATVVRDESTVLFRHKTKSGSVTTHILKEDYRFQPPSMTMLSISPIRPMRITDVGNFDASRVRSAKESRSGDIELRYSKGPINLRLVCAKSAGFNVTLIEVLRGGSDDQVSESESISWKKYGDRWHVSEFVRRSGRWLGGQKVGEDLVSLSYSQFDPTVEPKKDRFSIDSVGLNSGSRIQDHRPNAGETNHYYRSDPKAGDDASIDDSVDRLARSRHLRPWYTRKWLQYSVSAVGSLSDCPIRGGWGVKWSMRTQSYPSDVTDAQWRLIEPHLPGLPRRAAPRRPTCATSSMPSSTSCGPAASGGTCPRTSRPRVPSGGTSTSGGTTAPST